MNRAELQRYISETYGAAPEYPWSKYPEYAVFRHADSRKWFAVVMRIGRRKLGVDSEEKIDVVNVKCAVDILPTMWEQTGIFPAYHMSKAHWITVALDGSVTEENLKFLLDLSYTLTEK